MNIVLIGYRGTGKSAVAKCLADALNRPCVGLDDEIVRLAGTSIPEIVETSGWEHFRDLESRAVREAAQRDECIIDTGGGAILRDQNVACLKQSGILFWLQASVADIVSRIGGDDQRPSLTGAKSFTDEVEEVLAERTPRYAAAADHVLDTGNDTPDAVARHIIEILNRSA